MAERLSTLVDGLLQRRALRRWARAVDRAAELDLADLRAQRAQARQLSRQIDRLIHVADGRLALPLIGSNAIQAPLGSDWTCRPELWKYPVDPKGASAVETKTKLGKEIALYHDCKISELTVRQIRNTREEDLAPFGLRMDVFRFDGSFLSLVIDLPPEAADGVKRRHIIRLETYIELETPIEVFARLNVRHGPNIEQVVRELPLNENRPFVEFDLAYTNLNEKRVERLWVDLIFEGPQMNQITLRDVTLSRRPRAEL